MSAEITEQIPIDYSFKNFCIIDENEIEMVWKWRNHISVSQWMYSTNYIEFDNHLKFIESLKNTKSKEYWLVYRNKCAIGVFSIVDIKDSIGEWGYYIAPEFHGLNLSVEFYYFTLCYVFETLGFKGIYGYAKESNKAANSLNTLFGFLKEIKNREMNSIIEIYLFRELSADSWYTDIKNNSKIMRLLQLTKNTLTI